MGKTKAKKRTSGGIVSGKVEVALIGAGSMANGVHYPSLASFEDVKIVGLCDLDGVRLAATAEKFGIGATFSDYKEMLKKTKPDAVYALMPPHVIYDVAMDIMEAGHHLFIEKPPAVTTFQTMCLARMAKKKKIINAVGFQRRYHPLLTECYKQVKKKGRPHQVAVTFIKNAPPTEPHPYYRGAIDILHCDAIHAVDSLRYYCGLADVKSVSSVVRNLDGWYGMSFNALVHFVNDTVGILQTNWRAGRRFLKVDMHAMGATAYVDADGEGKVWFDNEDKPRFDKTFTESAGSDQAHVAQGFWAQSRAFIDAVKSGKKLHNDLADAVKSMHLVDMIYENSVNSYSILE